MIEEANPPYAVVANPGEVYARSIRRLSFEPKGWQVEFHRELRDALRAMKPLAAAPLRCTYTSADRALVDIENVLTYNIGTSNLGHLVDAGLILERCFATAPPLEEAAYPHLLTYRSDPHQAEVWEHWAPTKPLASITVEGWDCLRDHRVGDAWKKARAHAVDLVNSDTTPSEFGVILKITSPTPTNPLGALKPVLDGLIAALHRYNGPDTDVLAERATFLAPTVDAMELRNALTDPRDRPLGPWPWLIPRGQGVQVSPADDRLVALTVKVERGEPSIEATFLAVQPITS